MTAQRRLDVICLGRATLELHAQQLGARVEDAASFAQQLGGSAASIAFGCARLGLRTALVSRVGDDAAGRFVMGALVAEGCDVSHVAVDREPTPLALVGGHDVLRPRVHGDAGLVVDEGAVDEAFLAEARALVVTASQLVAEHADRVSLVALERARRAGVRTVVDLDDGPEPASDRVVAQLQGLLGRFDLVVGTWESLQAVGDTNDLTHALRVIRGLTAATVVVKLGTEGCFVIDERSESGGWGPDGSAGGAGVPPRLIDGEVPARLDDGLAIPGFSVEVVNDLGATDAFVAGLLKGWLTGLDWRAAGRLANACAELVVSRTGASAGMPTPAELDYFLSGATRPDPHLARLHRTTVRRRAWDELCVVVALDDRRRAFELAREAGAAEARLVPLEQLVMRAVAETERARSLHGHLGMIVDGGAIASNPGGWWSARRIEVPGSLPLELEGGRSIGSRLIAWPLRHVVACRVLFHPDAPVDERLEQETQLAALHDAVQVSGHELLLEVMLSSDRPSNLPSNDDTIARALKRLYNIGIYPEWWSLEAMSSHAWRQVDELIAARDPRCRGVLAIEPESGDAGDAGDAELRAAAASRSCRGIIVGRPSLGAPTAAWLRGAIDDDAFVARVRAAIEARVAGWRALRKEAT